MDDQQVKEAAWGARSRSVFPSEVGIARIVAETALKDVRSLVRMTRFDRTVRRNPPPVNPLFVWQYHSLFQRAGLRIGRQRSCPVVLFVDAPQVWEAAKWGVTRPGWGPLAERFGEMPQFRRADLVACISEEVAEATIARGAVADRVIVTPGTADSIRHRSPNLEAKKSLGLGDRPIVGWVGSFRPFHHAELLVRAVSLLQRDPEVTLVMIGEGPTRQHCVDLAAQLGLRKALFPGWIPHEQIVDHLAAFDVAVVTLGLTDEFHGSPTKLKEYLAAGRAIAAPAIGEMARMFEDGRDLLLYSPGNESELMKAIERILNDKSMRTTLEKEGQATYDRMFTLDRQLDVLAQKLSLPSSSP